MQVLREALTGGQSVPGAVERSAAMPVGTTAAMNPSVISACRAGWRNGCGQWARFARLAGC